jgi:hypothetical protein
MSLISFTWKLCENITYERNRLFLLKFSLNWNATIGSFMVDVPIIAHLQRPVAVKIQKNKIK